MIQNENNISNNIIINCKLRFSVFSQYSIEFTIQKSLLWNFIFSYSRKRWPEDKYDAHNKSGNKIFLLVDFLSFLKKLRKMKYFHVCDNISTFTSRKVLRWNVQNMTIPMMYPCKFMFTIRGRVVTFDWISLF